MSQKANYKAELIGVFGHPVAENPTVVMHEAAFKELGLNWRYLTIEVYPEDLKNAIKGLRAFNMKGINLTIPHKVEVLKYLDQVSEAAGLMGAVNTVVQEKGKLFGENTDGKGFMQALTQDANVDPAGKQIVVLGAGGAARAITVELALAGAAQITIVNRSVERGQALVNLLNEKTPTKANLVPWSHPYALPANTDVFINGTSIGLFPNVHEKPDIAYDTITSKMIVCDVIHSPNTPFLKKAKDCGAHTLDGVGMLVYQGAIGFKLWTGMEAPVPVMYQALAEAFGLASI